MMIRFQFSGMAIMLHPFIVERPFIRDSTENHEKLIPSLILANTP